MVHPLAASGKNEIFYLLASFLLCLVVRSLFGMIRQAFHSKQGDLLGDQTQHKYDDSSGQQKDRHIREASLSDVGVDVITDTAQEEKNAHRDEDTKGRKQGCDLGYNLFSLVEFFRSNNPKRQKP